MRLRFRLLQLSLMAMLAAAGLGGTRAQAIVRPTASVAALSNPILFVTQMPIAADFATIGAVFANHHADMQSVGRGGDLWIRYPDGTLKNLTADRRLRQQRLCRARMRSPCATRRSAGMARRRSSAWSWARRHNSTQVKTFFWQLYEVTGLGQNQTPVITKVPNQPANYNNISPIYGTDDRIIFVSDRPRDGASHLYPQFDEYELTDGQHRAVEPRCQQAAICSCSITRPRAISRPAIDSFGRVIFTRWDHLQRDQEADQDAGDVAQGQPPTYGTFNYADESAGAAYQFNARAEVFPEPRSDSTDLLRQSQRPYLQLLLALADQRRWHRGRNAQPYRPAGVRHLLRPKLQR